MRGDALDRLLVKPVKHIAVEFPMRILVGVGILRNRKVQCGIIRESEEGLPNHLGTKCIDRRNGLLQVVARPVFNVPASLQIPGFPHLEPLVGFGGPLWALEMISGRFLNKVRQVDGQGKVTASARAIAKSDIERIAYHRDPFIIDYRAQVTLEMIGLEDVSVGLTPIGRKHPLVEEAYDLRVESFLILYPIGHPLCSSITVSICSINEIVSARAATTYLIVANVF